MAVSIQTCDQLRGKHCVPCEGGVPKLTSAEAREQIQHLSGWELTDNDERIRKTWVLKDFMSALNLFNHVACVAECEGHHPDLHIERYRNVTIEIYTHAIGGLSENDFILAAKIDALPMKLK